MTPDKNPSHPSHAALIRLAWQVRQTRAAQRRAATSRMPADAAIAYQHEQRLDVRVAELLGDPAEPEAEGGAA